MQTSPHRSEEHDDAPEPTPPRSVRVREVYVILCLLFFEESCMV